MNNTTTTTKESQQSSSRKRRNDVGKKSFLKTVFLLIVITILIGCTVVNVNQFYKLYTQSLKKRFDISNVPALAPAQSTVAIIPLSELTRGSRRVNCRPPLVEVQNRIVESQENEEEEAGINSSKIPKSIHVSWKNRCVPPDLVVMIEKWKDQFPHYNFYLHDDEAVDRLMFEQEWEEFPQMQKIAKSCIVYGGAVKIDIWRVLVLYQYGGIYSDIDTGPGPHLTEDKILPDDTAFFVSDFSNRPSHWLQAMEPRHPIAYFTMLEIMTRLLGLKDVAKIRPVYTTGPDALRFGYELAMEKSQGKDIFSPGLHKGKYQKQIHKLSARGRVSSPFDNPELVPYNDGKSIRNVTIRERIELQTKSIHWSAEIKRKRERNRVTRGSCVGLLYAAETP